MRHRDQAEGPASLGAGTHVGGGEGQCPRTAATLMPQGVDAVIHSLQNCQAPQPFILSFAQSVASY